MKLEDLIKLNPKLILKKGVPAPFIEMAALPTNEKFIREIGQRKAIGSGAKFQNGDTLFARITPCLENGKGGYVSGLPDGVVGQGSTEFIVLRARKKSDEQFAYYLSRFQKFRSFAEKGMEGTSGRQRVTWQTLADFELPDLSEMQRAALGDVLGSLDDKIELNRRMNETLEEMARALFRDWFIDFGPTRRQMDGATDPAAIMGHAFPDDKAAALAPLFPARLGENGLPEGWGEKPLDEIAHFLNGLALQRYPAHSDQPDLPVIKIAELRSGITAKTNRASKRVPEKYVIRNGDFIFSWSGSLLAKFWTGGPGALNQHLFRVTSKTHPMWFVSEWVYAHLEEFQRIASAKAVTMGHIKRSHLSEAMCTCPDADRLEILGVIFEPLIKNQIANDEESQTLADMRDLLLPKLMSGEIQLKDALMVQDTLD